MTDEEITFAIITAVVAIYGAVLSSVLTIREYLKTRPRVKLYYEFEDKYNYRLTVRIVNENERPVTIVESGFLDKKGHVAHRYTSSKSVLPHTLTYGESVQWFLSGVKDEKYAQAYAKDAAGKMYTVKIKLPRWVLLSPKRTNEAPADSQTAKK